MLWADFGDIVIARRGADYLVIHAQNVRWFRTDETGARVMCSLAKHLSRQVEPFSCNRYEAEFVRKVVDTGLFESPRDMPVNRPGVVCVSITERCNLECDYCFYSASYRRNRASLHVRKAPLASLRVFLMQLCQMNPHVRVYLTGGEPFCNKDILVYFRLVKEFGLYAGVVTNATMFSHKLMMEMKEIDVNEVRVSLDGITCATHEVSRPGTFNRVLCALTRLKDAALHVVLSMTVTSRNQHEVEAVAEFASCHGFAVSYSPAVPTGRAYHHPELLPDYQAIVDGMVRVEERFGFSFFNLENAQGVRRHTCGLAGQSLYVNLEGTASPCNMLSTTGHRVGNVFEQALDKVLASDAAHSSRVVVDSVAYCRNCPVRYICGGPCRATSYFAVGRMDIRGPDCRFKYAEVIESMFRNAPVVLGNGGVA